MNERELELKLNKEHRISIIRRAVEKVNEEIRVEESNNDIGELDFNDDL